jgi:hypothetical protein
MAQWYVEIEIHATYVTVVEAEDEEAARDAAEMEARGCGDENIQAVTIDGIIECYNRDEEDYR